MASKRRRLDVENSPAQVPSEGRKDNDNGNGSGIPLSAIAARKRLLSDVPSSDGSPALSARWDSSDSDVPRMDVETEKKNRARVDPRAVSSFKATESNVAIIKSDGEEALWIVGLQRTESICFQGAVLLASLKGSVSIQGYELPYIVDNDKATFYRVYAPTSHPAPRIKASAYDEAPLTDSHPILYTLAASGTFDHSIYPCVIALRTLSKSGIVDIGKVLPMHSHIFPRQEGLTWPDGFVPIFEATLGVVSHHVPESWDATVDTILSAPLETVPDRPTAKELAPEAPLKPFWAIKKPKTIPQPSHTPPVVIICGSKGVGKSTFASHFVNCASKKYSKIAYLDCDVGQTTFTPPGLVSLTIVDGPMLGPTWAIQKAPYRSHFFGAASPKDDPVRYIELISDLVEVYRIHFADKDVPLIINTQGWVRGLGLDMLLQTCRLAEPTEIVQFHSAADPNRNIPDLLTNLTRLSGRFHLTAAIESSGEARFRAIDHRNAAIVAYFCSTGESRNAVTTVLRLSDGHIHLDEMNPLWNFSLLTHLIPRALRFDKGTGVDAFHFVGADGYNQLPVSEVLHALNGVVVALVQQDGATRRDAKVIAKNERLSTSTIPYTRGMEPPHAQLTQCASLALIRAIDPMAMELQMVIGPALSNVKVPIETQVSIVRGPIDLPISAIYADGDAPYISKGSTEGVVGIAARRFRRNIMRKVQRT